METIPVNYEEYMTAHAAQLERDRAKTIPPHEHEWGAWHYEWNSQNEQRKCNLCPERQYD